MPGTLINSLGGPSGFGTRALARGDDVSSTASVIDFQTVFASGINFFGIAFTELFINNNGNLTFTSAISNTQGFNFANNLAQPVIAPFWADVDTRVPPTGGTTPGGTSTGSNLVYFHFDTVGKIFTATWDDVGRFENDNSVRNAFQVRLIKANVLDSSAFSTDFDIEFRYEDINWANSSVGNGTPTLGFAKGTGLAADAVLLPQSGIVAAALTLESQSNIGDPGRFLFNIRSGVAVLPTEGNNRLTGTNDRERFDGLGGQDDLFGFGGNDTLLGGGGSDRIFGGEGDDLLEGGASANFLDGGQGFDIASFANSGLRVSVFMAGLTTVGGDTLSGIEGAIGSAFDDLFYGDGVANSFAGGGGIDVAFGGNGNDTIDLGEGNDAAAGEAGNDVIFGGTGTEYLYGGAGNDVLYGQSGVDFLFGEDNDDAVYGGLDTDGISGGNGNDYLFGEEGIDYLFGDEGNDYVYGGAEFDFIYGGGGVDALFGEGGGDFLAGEGGTDYIAGGDGDDYIYGGDGVDFLYGDKGNDVFAGGLGTPDAFYHDGFIGGNDLVLDFEAGLDVLVLLGTGFTSAAQALATASFVNGGATLFTGGGASVTLFGIGVADLNAGNVFIG